MATVLVPLAQYAEEREAVAMFFFLRLAIDLAQRIAATGPITDSPRQRTENYLKRELTLGERCGELVT